MRIATLLITLVLTQMFNNAIATNAPSLERIQQVLVAPPFLPIHDQSQNGQSKIVEITLEIEEKELEIAPNVYVQAMTFNGSVPGPIIVVHQDDYVELTLKNPATNTMFHNIDLHAATGSLGGAGLTGVNPGEEVTMRFKATKPGAFVYHCAPGGSLIPYHVVAGMNGAILVLPKGGLRDDKNKKVTYDKAYYIGEQDFYIPKNEQGEFIRYATLNDALSSTFSVMKNLTPSHVVFNGSVSGLTGSNGMTAAVGENVLFIHGQANRDSRPHIVGGHADLVWPVGSFSTTPMRDIETWFVPGGSAVVALYEFRQPGLYVYVNHNLIEALLLGAAAHINVTGDWDDDLMTQVSPPRAIINP